MRQPLREMMLFHTRTLSDPKAKVDKARALFAFLADATANDGSPYGLLLQQELAKLERYSDDYVRHDLLGEVNQPFYFHEFVSLAANAHLQYLSEPLLAQMLPLNLPPKTQDTIRKLGKDPIAQEQYMDFVRNQNFRQTLLCHAGASLTRNITPERIKSFYYTSLIIPPDEGALQLDAGVVHDFKLKNTTATLKVENPFPKAVFERLAQAKLARVSYPELVQAARAKAQPFLVDDAHQRRATQDEAALPQTIMQLYMRGLIDIYAEQSPLTLAVAQKPAATALARYQAEQTHLVTNRAHDSIPLDGNARFVVIACNGQRDAAGIVDWLTQLAKNGTLKLSDPGLEQAAEVRASIENLVAIALPKLAAAGFF